MRKTRILISSHSPCIRTGQAGTLRLIFEALLNEYGEDYELYQVAQFHRIEVCDPPWPVFPTKSKYDNKGSIVYPPEDAYGELTFDAVMREVQPDIVFAYGDPQCVVHICQSVEVKHSSVILYLNFDGVPVPAGYDRVLGNADAIFTKTQFSLNAVMRECPELGNLEHGVMYTPANTARFVVLDSDDKKKLRSRWCSGNPISSETFVLGWIGRNQWRKQPWIPFQAIHYLRKGAYAVCANCAAVNCYVLDPAAGEHGEVTKCRYCKGGSVAKAGELKDIILWCHMSRTGAWPLKSLMNQFGLVENVDVVLTAGEQDEDSGLVERKDIAGLYNVWDALLYCSGGEGFGNPAWEAMCAGMPVIYTNYSGHAEFLNASGGGLPVTGVFQPERDTCIWRMIANIDEVVQAVRALYYDRQLRERLGCAGREFVEAYSVGEQVQKWNSIFHRHAMTWRRRYACALGRTVL